MPRFRMPALLAASLLLGSCNPSPTHELAGDDDPAAAFDLAPRVEAFLAETVATAFARVYAEQGLEAAKAAYRRLESEAAEEVDFGDGHLSRLGYFYLGQGQTAEAIDTLRFNVELYPEVGNCHDSLAEAYMGDGQDQLAIASYRQALELDPDNDNARQMLARLGAGSG